MMKYIVLTTICVTVIAIGSFFFLSNSDTDVNLSMGSHANQAESEMNNDRIPPAGHKEYVSEQYGFSFFIPNALIASEFDEGGGASTIIFETEDGERGFQLFVVPYFEEVITEERLAFDLPSGILNEQIEIMVGETRASAFYSEHPLMGETREVWFIHNDHLYEIVTYKELDQWLADIVNTWIFI